MRLLIFLYWAHHMQLQPATVRSTARRGRDTAGATYLTPLPLYSMLLTRKIADLGR